MNGNMQPHYLLEFPGSDSEASSVTIVATGETSDESSTMTQNCSKLRMFWVSRSKGVISGGSGLTPGKKEVVRLAVDEKSAKNVVMAWMSTQPVDENATFTTYHGETQFPDTVDATSLKIKLFTAEI